MNFSKIGLQNVVDLKEVQQYTKVSHWQKPTLQYKRSANSITLSISPTGTISLFPKSTFNSITASNQVSNIQMYKICSVLASQNKMVSLANNKCEIDNPPFSSFPTLKLLTRPSSYIFLNILLRSPITRIKSK